MPHNCTKIFLRHLPCPCEDFVLAGGTGTLSKQVGARLVFSSPSRRFFPSLGRFLTPARQHLAEDSGALSPGTVPHAFPPPWSPRAPTPSPQLSIVHVDLPFLCHRLETVSCALGQSEASPVSRLSGLTVLRCLMSNVLKALVSFLQSGFLVASGGQLNLAPITLLARSESWLLFDTA